MGSLVIVESPAKARTINKILGKEFRVEASVGHVMDLPAKSIGVDVENGFKPEYIVIPSKEKVIRELKSAAKGAENIYIATDPDREGEAIAHHIQTQIGGKKGNVYRVTFNEITPKVVREAIKAPRQVDMDRVYAQQARRVLDRLVGYNLSPLLWRKVRRGLSAGRVQSVAVRLIVEREREISAFKTEEYWSITARLAGAVAPEFDAKLHIYGGSPVIKREEGDLRTFLIKDEQTARRISDEISAGKFSLTKIERQRRRRSPQPPFITSTLQQEASRKLGFPAKRIMALAQELYEGVELGAEGAHGLITYMRTDSVRVSTEAQDWARTVIAESFGADYVPDAPPVYKSKASAQEGHEAIRPTDAAYAPKAVKQYLSRDLLKLYTLIWNRFMASQMKPAELEQTSFDIACGTATPAIMRAAGTVVKFPGFMALYMETKDENSQAESNDDDEAVLPPLNEGDALGMKALAPKQHFTSPPPRYTEATLVKTLEDKGIGRPSTYAAILSTIADRKYAQKVEGRFSPSELGMIVNDYLVDKFPELLDTGFTAKMEDQLDGIEEGKADWVKVISDFFGPFKEDLAQASAETGKVKPEDIETEHVCEKCEKPMVIRWGRHGRFLACSGYPECKNSRPLDGDKPQVADTPTDEVCDKCASPMVIKTGRFGKFMACTKYPECKSTRPLPTGVKCPKDGGDLVERRTKKGRSFWSCSNYPKCDFATWSRPVAEPCPKCKAPLLAISRNKAGDTVKSCLDKECGFKEEIKETA